MYKGTRSDLEVGVAGNRVKGREGHSAAQVNPPTALVASRFLTVAAFPT